MKEQSPDWQYTEKITISDRITRKLIANSSNKNSKVGILIFEEAGFIVNQSNKILQIDNVIANKKVIDTNEFINILIISCDNYNLKINGTYIEHDQQVAGEKTYELIGTANSATDN